MLRQAFEDEVLAASPEDWEALIADFTGVVNLPLDTTSLALGEPDDTEAAELRGLTEVNRATFGHPLVMYAEHVADRSQFITQGWPRMKMADGRETRTSVGKVVDERFSTMNTDANPIRSAWAREFEKLDSRGHEDGPWTPGETGNVKSTAKRSDVHHSTQYPRRQSEKIRV